MQLEWRDGGEFDSPPANHKAITGQGPDQVVLRWQKANVGPR